MQYIFNWFFKAVIKHILVGFLNVILNIVKRMIGDWSRVAISVVMVAMLYQRIIDENSMLVFNVLWGMSIICMFPWGLSDVRDSIPKWVQVGSAILLIVIAEIYKYL